MLWHSSAIVANRFWRIALRHIDLPHEVQMVICTVEMVFVVATIHMTAVLGIGKMATECSGEKLR